jgi:hypothetical protein
MEVEAGHLLIRCKPARDLYRFTTTALSHFFSMLPGTLGNGLRKIKLALS